jgi:DNA invertase Pin-like site-specific DNA recombinase
VSSTRQKEEGKSLKDQDRELRDYCRAMGYRIIGNFEDAVSGRREKTEKREGLAQAIALACERKATLIVYDLDRLARSQSVGLRIVEQLRDCGAGIAIKSLGIDTNTPSGEMILGIMFAVAQWGSRAIGEGVKRANRQTVEQLGYRTQGRQPLGWRVVEGKRVPHEGEQELLATILDAFEDNGRCCYRTARWLQENGVETPRSYRWGHERKWHHQTVRNLVDRAYTSDLTQSRKIVENRVDEKNAASI